MSPGFDTPYNYKDKVVGAPKVEVDPGLIPLKRIINRVQGARLLLQILEL